MTPEEFKAAFTSRTLAYQPDYVDDGRPIVVVISDHAHSVPGHALAVALVNQLARAHGRLVIVGPSDEPLQCVDHFRFGTLGSATAGLAAAINPFIDVAVETKPPEAEALLTIGLGTNGCDLNLGCDGWRATVSADARIDTSPKSLLGAFLASVLAANTAFHRVTGNHGVPSGSFSLWEWGALGAPQGPSFTGPIDVGTVLQVGAGAVGCALVYWLAFLGVTGDWLLVDGDLVDVSNLNRQLMFLAADAGYPDGAAGNKAATVAARVGAPFRSSPEWYGDDDAVVTGAYDLVVPLANEHGARAFLQARSQTILLHATTSPNWQAQTHRHIAGHDDCISCRIPSDQPAFTCATGSVGETIRADASIPALAAAAGLLLLTNIARLQTGDILATDTNYHALELRTPHPVAQQTQAACRDGCRGWMPAPQRLARTCASTHAHLDGARQHGD